MRSAQRILRELKGTSAYPDGGLTSDVRPWDEERLRGDALTTLRWGITPTNLLSISVSITLEAKRRSYTQELLPVPPMQSL